MANKLSDEELMIQAMMDTEGSNEALDGMSFDATAPQQKEGFYKLLRDLKDTKDSKKIANLTYEELGKSELSLRGALKLGLLCDTIGISALGDCYRKEGEILAATSMSRYTKGPNFLNLIFTQIKKSVSGVEPQAVPEKKPFWGKRSD